MNSQTPSRGIVRRIADGVASAWEDSRYAGRRIAELNDPFAGRRRAARSK